MSLITPNFIYTINTVTINEKIIQDGTRWKDSAKAYLAGFYLNALYKKEKKLTEDTGTVMYITIHNTNDLKNVYDDGEQYTRATYNENMGSARVHFYVDDTGAWQNLRAGTGLSVNDPIGSAEVGWHAGDGSIPDGGNMTSLALEIIMDETAEHDLKAKDNGARIAAWLLWKHNLSIDRLVTHTYWVNKNKKKVFSDVDVQCTTPIPGEKWCPSYILGSTNSQMALSNWLKFKNLVYKYLCEINNSDKNTIKNIACKIQEGDLVSISTNATYYNGKAIPEWVKSMNWYVSSINGNRVVIDENETKNHSIKSPINVKFLRIVKEHTTTEQTMNFKPYRIKVTTDCLSIYSGASIMNICVGHIKDKGVYTIIAESNGTGATKWGKLKSGVGWISLDYTNKI